ncbi:DUF1998 domain-containing protein [Micromonospora sp. NPDC007271]|uniref:DUF1998 domain-containing protein n=1 Tax=Micromonospora sp. NPDC007271 TaxID=3154587 RepID=UPI0033FC1A32
MMRPGLPLRRAQLIAPFGVGAMVTGPDGISVMTAGLDAWFRREDGGDDTASLDITEFKVDEWRLERYLGVAEFRLPPDYRDHRGPAVGAASNTSLTVPAVRFPQMHFCRNFKCLRLSQLPLHARGRKRCSYCAKGSLAQVPFVAVCPTGHAQDFPFKEWVHRSVSPSCRGVLRLRSTGGASLAAMVVDCDCGASRNMGGITDGGADQSYLSSNLANGEQYRCLGRTPWHGTEEEFGCGNPLKGSLRSASNVYYAVTRSSIYLPQSDDSAVEALLQLFDSHMGLSTVLRVLRDAGQVPDLATVRNTARADLDLFSDDALDAAIGVYFTGSGGVPKEDDSGPGEGETEFRRAEFSVLGSPQMHDELESRAISVKEYGDWMAEHFERIVLVDRLRETRALVGFERIVPETPARIEERKALLRRRGGGGEEDWLPAALVYGEGLFFVLREDRIAGWEMRESVMRRAELLQGQFLKAAKRRSLRERDLGARLPMLHTFAHLLINQLTFECGYSSASLRERLYVSPSPNPMAGVLIYTAAGDAEGTMGGLVRVGRPEYLTGIVAQALRGATWCSTDPVCMEVGSTSGQGPDSCNLAACHSCALVPETACEQFNRFLDRGLVVGSIDQPDVGFFADFG